MYSSNYEEYMQNVLGYSIRPQNTYQLPENIYEMPRMSNYEDINLEGLYPDIYKMINPMVQKVCMKTTGIINEEVIASMTEEVYKAATEEVRNYKDTTKTSSEVRTSSSQNTRKIEEFRQSNYLLRDLIRILIINELLRRRQGRHPRLPMGPGFPGGSNFPSI